MFGLLPTLIFEDEGSAGFQAEDVIALRIDEIEFVKWEVLTFSKLKLASTTGVKLSCFVSDILLSSQSLFQIRSKEFKLYTKIHACSAAYEGLNYKRIVTLKH